MNISDCECNVFAIRWSFLTSLFALLLSVSSRILIEFNLLTKERNRLGCAAALFFGSVVSFLMSHVNSTLNCWPNLWGMTIEVLLLTLERVRQQKLLAIVSLVALMASVALFCFDLLHTALMKYE
jgi:hypothetical protein